jgi:hypothetical protein
MIICSITSSSIFVVPRSSDVSEFRPFGAIDTTDEGNAHSDVMEEFWSRGIPTKDKEYVQQEEIEVRNKIQEEITKNIPPVPYSDIFF